MSQQKATFTPTAPGWYRIISAAAPTVGGTIRISGAFDNEVTDVELQFNIAAYGQAGSIQGTRFASYNGGNVSQARVSSDGIYNLYLDIYVPTATNPGPLSLSGSGPWMVSFVASPVVGAVAGVASVSTLTLDPGFSTTSAFNIAPGGAYEANGVPIIQAGTALQNYFFGGNAGNSSMTGVWNTGIGSYSLSGNTTGDGNSAVGRAALSSNTTGASNTAVGALALQLNTTGSGNSSLGWFTLFLNTTGSDNTGVGQTALQFNTTGSQNTALGNAALQYITTGSNNIGLGAAAGTTVAGGSVQNQTSSNSIYIGNSANAIADGDSNEIVIGNGTTGSGSNTVTLGNPSIATTVLRGNVKVSGQVLFPDGSSLGSTSNLLTANTANTGSAVANTLQATGASTVPSTQGAYMQWNLSGGAGETDLINNRGGGWRGGFTFYDSPASGSPLNPLVTIQGNGNVGLETENPLNVLTVSGGLNVDANDDNSGYPFYNGGSSILGLSFGLSSGEGISSARVIGSPNQYGLDFFTGFQKRLSITGTGNVGIGTVTPGATLEVNGSIKLSSGSGASVTFPDNTVQATAWNGTTLGGDYAESIDVLGNRTSYEPGDVIVIDADEDARFKKSDVAYSQFVAGVYSTKPGLVGRRTTAARPDKEAEVPMAMMGIVPVKVSAENGPIKRGDLLVTSNTPGYAMKGSDRGRLTGAVIGKALAPLDLTKGVIEVLVSLQ